MLPIYLSLIPFGIMVIIGIVISFTVIEVLISRCITFKLPYSLESNTIEIPFQKSPDSEVPCFRDCVVFAPNGYEYDLDDFHFHEVYWLFDSEGNYIRSYLLRTSIPRKSCVFALTPCKLGDVLIRGTLFPAGKKIINFYTLNKVNESTLSFSKFATLNNPRHALDVSGELEKFRISFKYLNLALDHRGAYPIPLEFIFNCYDFW